MATIKLDLTGLKCPLPALKTRKALRTITPGDFLEVHCTDPLSVIDIPNLIRETGDKVEITERVASRISFSYRESKSSDRKRLLTACASSGPFGFRLLPIRPNLQFPRFRCLRMGEVLAAHVVPAKSHLNWPALLHA
jgi:tRNA 2-thiouridine synthesizing protein A